MSSTSAGLEAVEDFQASATEMREVLTTILELKRGGATTGDNAELAQAVKDLSLVLVDLRGAARGVHTASEGQRMTTQETKEHLDEYNLQLQNLEYERYHLEGEILRCRDFRWSEGDVGLLSPDEFREQAPAEMATVGDDHQFMLNRLTFEKQERERLTAETERLEEERREIEEYTARENETLESLHADLDKLLTASLPVQEKLSITVSRNKEQNALAKHLPTPLFVLFNQWVTFQGAYSDAGGVEIEGNATEALRLTQEAASSAAAAAAIVSATAVPASKGKGRAAGDSDDDDDDDDDAASTLFEPHPLAVVATVGPGEGDVFGEPLVLRFEYVPRLNVITVVADGGGPAVLANLFPNDTGAESPNPSNKFVLPDRTLRYNDPSGRLPYRWAQWMGGLDFVANDASVDSSGKSFQAVMRRLRLRLNASHVLTHDLLPSLEAGTLPCDDVSAVYSTRPRATLSDFRTGGEDDVAALLRGDGAEWSHVGARCFQATLQREGVTVTARFVVTPEYPVRAPLFRLAIKGSSKHIPNDAQNVLSAIERKLNAEYPDLLVDAGQEATHLLAYQLRKLQHCVDVFVDSQFSSEGDAAIRVRRQFGRDREFVAM